jgi:hypothetical protein
MQVMEPGYMRTVLIYIQYMLVQNKLDSSSLHAIVGDCSCTSYLNRAQTEII